MSPRIRLRPARAADVPAIRACAAAAFAPYVPLIGRAPAPMVADFERLVAAGYIHIAVENPVDETRDRRPEEPALADGGLLGYVSFWPEGEAMMLDAVATHPRAAGRGLGRCLVTHVEAEARARNLVMVRLYTNARMSSNLTLYPHLGYAQVARVSEAGFDRVYFEKTLV